MILHVQAFNLDVRHHSKGNFQTELNNDSKNKSNNFRVSFTCDMFCSSFRMLLKRPKWLVHNLMALMRLKVYVLDSTLPPYNVMDCIWGPVVQKTINNFKSTTKITELENLPSHLKGVVQNSIKSMCITRNVGKYNKKDF